jgi:hypothetical protein
MSARMFAAVVLTAAFFAGVALTVPGLLEQATIVDRG